jgi:hypothetical protein
MLTRSLRTDGFQARAMHGDKVRDSFGTVCQVLIQHRFTKQLAHPPCDLPLVIFSESRRTGLGPARIQEHAEYFIGGD